MKFLKYRHNWNCSNGEYEYWMLHDVDSYFTIDDYVEDVIDRLEQKYQFNEGYRGLDYEVVESVPEVWLQKEIEVSDLRIKGQNSYINDLQHQLTKQNL